jgi:hypothetical protein
MVGRRRFDVKARLRVATEIPLSAFSEFSNTASKATVEAGNSVVVFMIADLGSATRASSTQPNHKGCPWELHGSTVVLSVMNSSVIMCLRSGNSSVLEIPIALPFLIFIGRPRFRSMVVPQTAAARPLSATADELSLKFRGLPRKIKLQNILRETEVRR